MAGLVATELVPSLDDDMWELFGRCVQPLWGRVGRRNEIASVVLFLISDEASFISGTNIMADGLWSLSGGAPP